MTRLSEAGWRFIVFLLALGVSVVACGLLAPTRTASIRLANRLLGTALPAPMAGTSRPDRATRARAAAWLLVHVLAGWIVTVVAGLLVLTACFLVGSWLRGGDRIQLFGLSVPVAAGGPGAWTLFAAAAALVLAAWSCAGSIAGFRALALALLGPGAADRFAALEARLRGLEQRTELARELHDSIGHTLTAATIQAAVAAELLGTDPAGARRALSHIEESSRSALDDLDHVLGVLRTGAAATSPRRTLADLPTLLDRVRSTGTEVHADVRGDGAGVPATVSREAYRLVQEGLTNVLRHAHRAPVTLRVVIDGDWLTVELGNPVTRTRGIARRRSRQGQGVTGMAERVRLLHGEFTAGPTPGGQWRLTARIPLWAAP
ncbi:sensor histidine kinase [Streptomyces hainanensis]|uniref:sensor histidine kinase n=1 Tax=Streptomyces hainanensis TaxID=402648 RepID=UPI001FB6D454|nr:histidine kinase [Streptomyces hainanensis]